MKTCPKCKTTKPSERFHKSKKLSQGLACWCKDCDRAKRIAYRSRPEYSQEVTERNKKYLSRPEVAKKKAEYDKIYRHSDNRVTYIRKWQLKNNYGLTPEQFDILFIAQGRKCKVCGSADPRKKGDTWSVDHDHQTGKVRGILCHGCNTGIGFFKDNPDHLRKAAAYLEASQTVTMPTEEVLRG